MASFTRVATASWFARQCSAGPAHARRGLLPCRDITLSAASHDVTREPQSGPSPAAATSTAAATQPLAPAAGGPAATAPHDDDERFMRLALEQARLAFDDGEVPVGAVLVSGGGQVLAAARNAAEGAADPTAHAELLCIRQAATAAGGWRLLDATLYVTLEPCPMCAGALLQSRVGTVVYGARNTLLGADGSWIAMLPQSRAGEGSASGAHSGSGGTSSAPTQGSGVEQLQAAPAAAAAVQPTRPHPFHPNMVVRRGVLAAECGDLMRSFFARRRK